MFGDSDGGTLDGGRRASLVDLARQVLGCPEGPITDLVLRHAITQAEFDRSCCRAAMGRSRPAVRASRVRMHGGMAVTDEADIGLFLKRARVTELMFGVAAYHRNRYATLAGY